MPAISPASADTFSGTVISVTDGDTIKVMHNGQPEKIRLNGIDAPEHDQAFGQKAKTFTSDCCFGKIVTVEGNKRDRYGRTIGEIVLPNGIDVNHEIMKAGLAWWFRKYAPHDSDLEQLEQSARDRHVGLWADAHPVAPWDFRRLHKKHET